MIFQFIILFLLTLSTSSDCRNRVGATFLSNVTDQQALLSVRNSITVGSWGLLNSWNHSMHFCQWQGVVCSHRRQRVTALNLSSQQLEGTLSPHIGNLSFLRSINLYRNNFHGPIPGEIGKLFRLQNLHLGSNLFQGGFPVNLSHCTDARLIRVEDNNLVGDLPTDFTSWSKLTKFNATKNHFTGVISSTIGNISSLLALDLWQNNLTGSIPLEIANNFKLQNLNLGDNKFGSTVPLQLYNISSLQVINFSGNQFEGTFPADLGFTLPNLLAFMAEDNQFSGAFPLSITNASELQYFDISFNYNITGPLPMNFGRLWIFKYLGTGSNSIGYTQQPGGLSFLDSLVNCTHLKYLDISGNGFSGEFPNFIGNLSTRLNYVDFSHNFIHGSIPQETGKLFNLAQLALNGNMLTGNIPESICKLSILGELVLDDNNISGIIPACISNITGSYSLSFSRNILSGRIPAALFNISSLHALYLDKNHLSGVIPDLMVERSSQGVIVDLNQNQLTGSLPFNIGSLKLLAYLDVSSNKLTGNIPVSLGDCLMLENLYMDGNLFQGTIPSSFQVLKGVAYLDLSNNNLTGNIPHFFEKFHVINFLNLSHNKLKGEVPKRGLFLNVSDFSVAGNLQLCGGIPALELPACPAKILKSKNKQFPLRIVPLIVLVPLVTVIACFIFVFYRIKKSRLKNVGTTLVLQDDQYPRLSYQDLLLATNKFSSNNFLGEGRYGSVYKGILESSQQIVAVKVLHADVHGANRSFLAECETLRNIRHRNLVKIITACSSTDFKGGEFKALVFEFMTNGSLDDWLHPSSSVQGREKNLTLLQRLNTAIDVALAVDYIHHHCPSKIVHCDLKPSNILLDEEFVARVSDFGLARIILTSNTCHLRQAHTSSTGVRGTVGYVPPEYGMGGKISVEGDVYSYGILLLEMFSGKRPTDTNILLDHANNLHDYVRNAVPHRVTEIADPRIIPQNEDQDFMEVCLASIFEIGVLCSVETPRKRIDISVAIKKLQVARDKLLQCV